MADSSVHSRPMAAQGAEDGEIDLEDVENTDPDYAQDRENDSEFEATEEDLFQGGIYEPSVRIQVQGSEEESEGPGGDGVRPRPGAPEERGCSIRKIRLGNLFVRMTRSTSHLDDYLDVFVLVVVSRKSKTNPNNKLNHQFLARHRDWRLCGMGHVFLWLYFIYDLVPLRYGPGIVEPLDFSEPILWTKAHLFFSLKKGDQGEQKQDEMHYKTHNTWIKWAMTKARWILSKVTHAFRRSGAQQLHDDGCSDNDIGTLGGWAQGELRRCYVFGIPFKPVWLLAGFSGDRGDYYIGRARAKLPRHKVKEKDEWLQLLDLLRLHIFPWVEEGWKKVEEWNAAQTDPLKRHYAGARFLDTLASIGRLVVAQDLAMMWAFCHQHGVRNPRCNCERHPYVQMSPLCNHPLFQKWAYLVAISHFQGEKLRATGQTTAKADAIFRTTAEEKLHKMHLTANMLREELGILRGREMQLAMENAELREKLAAEREDKARVIAEFEAYKRSVAARDDAANTSAEIDGSSKSAGTGGNQATDASKAPVAVQEFFVVVVVSWREATTVAAAWKVWVQPSLIMGGRSLREVFAEFDRYKKKDKNSSFITAYSRFAVKGTPGMAVGACERKMRRVHRVMVSVETLRKDSSEAATATAIKLLDEVLLVCNFTEFTNGLAVLHETPTIKKQKTGSSTEKRTVNDLAQRRVGWLLVKKGLRDQEWATSLFGDDEWEEIHKEHMAQKKAEEEKQRTAAAKKAEREKATGEASKRKEQK
ncbi:unnamed protein product [Closterium sp. NIES-65]|nr:unnamed protein product [Closterium sp. NIES-65]